MERPTTENNNIDGFTPLISPSEIKKRFPMNDRARQTVIESRQQVRAILSGADSRMLAIVGPCSIHDYNQAIEYATRLRRLCDRVQDRLLVIMRVYFEKPRTQKGWRGLIIDPRLDGSSDIAAGIALARKLLLEIVDLGVAAASEVLDPIIPHYIADLLSWTAIGARTTESQIHRELSSGLSMPVGFKNSRDGSFTNSVNAMQVALGSHKFIGIDNSGQLSVVATKGNPDVHLILRGGTDGPNYHSAIIADVERLLESQQLQKAVMVDCSHANSNKDYRLQPQICRNVVQQRLAGQRAICGFMLESYLNPGKQSLAANLADLQWGVSLTDGCIGWRQTEDLLLEVSEMLSQGSTD